MSRANPRYKRNNPSGLAVGAGNVSQYIIQGAIENQLTVSVFSYYGNVVTPSPTQMAALLTSASGIIRAAYVACLSLDWTLTRELWNVVSTNTLKGVVSTANAGVAGGRTTGHFPTEVAAVMLKNTPLKGQHGRGRLSLPAIALADVTASTITAVALKTAMTSLGTAMLLAPTDGTNSYAPCVGQRSLASPKPVTFYSLLSSVSSTYLLGTIRRRKIGRGR